MVGAAVEVPGRSPVLEDLAISAMQPLKARFVWLRLQSYARLRLAGWVKPLQFCNLQSAICNLQSVGLPRGRAGHMKGQAIEQTIE
jgi:hypothetical protein